MNKSQRNFYLLVFLFLIIGLLIGHRAMADSCSTDCSRCGSQESCQNDGPDCVWIKTRAGEYCRRALEIEWPSSPIGTRLDSKSGAAEVIKYLYEWGISLGGIAAFISLIMAGFQYLTSVGEEGKMREARDNIQSSLLGLILLLSAWLILNTLNPQLTLLEKPEIEGVSLPDFPVIFPDEELTEPRTCEEVRIYLDNQNCEGVGELLNIGQCTTITAPQSIKATRGDCNMVSFYSAGNCSASSSKGMPASLIQDSCLPIPSEYNASGEPIRSIFIGENATYQAACDNDCSRCRSKEECKDSYLGSCCWDEIEQACTECENLDCNIVCGACTSPIPCYNSPAGCQWNSISNTCIINY